MSTDPIEGSSDWAAWRRAVDLDEYESRWDRIAEQGGNPHGEVDFVMAYAPRTAIDAGCGFGRVAIELTARGVETIGVDLDADLFARAQRRAPEIDWRLEDLATVEIGRTVDLVVVAGNVIGFVEVVDRPEAVRNCARHVAPGGHLVIGNQLKASWPTVEEIDRWSAEAGLVLVDRFGGWDREDFDPNGEYVVTVHGRPN